MTNYQFQEAITGDDGDEVAFPILGHELYSKPYKLEGVPSGPATTRSTVRAHSWRRNSVTNSKNPTTTTRSA